MQSLLTYVVMLCISCSLYFFYGLRSLDEPRPPILFSDTIRAEYNNETISIRSRSVIASRAHVYEHAVQL